MQAYAMRPGAYFIILAVPHNSLHNTHALLFTLRTDLHAQIVTFHVEMTVATNDMFAKCPQ